MTSHQQKATAPDLIAQRRAQIDGQEILLETLERDGHDVTEHRKSLRRLRQEQAADIASYFSQLNAADLSRP